MSLTPPVRSLSVFPLVLFLLALVPLQTTQAQGWAQTARVITPVEDIPPWEGPRGSLRALLDSVVHVAENAEETHLIKRRPSQEEKMSISALKQKLLDEEGLSVRSASHAIIKYRFEFDGENNFQELVQNIQYVYRSDASEEDIRLIYLTSKDKWFKDILFDMGTPTSQNIKAEILFRAQIRFTKISEDPGTQLIEIGNRTVREGFHQKKQDFVNKVYRLTYDFLTE